MSINKNRKKYNKAFNNSEYKKMLLRELYPPYWDDGIIYGYYPMKIRMYRTWKHNRKTQWK